MNYRAVLFALLSAGLFALSTPLAKLLLGTMDPMVLAGLLYVGAGFGTGGLRSIGGLRKRSAGEVSISRNEVGWLVGAIMAGGIAGPILLMAGLAQTAASTASLLLVLEGVATALIAWFVFDENFNRRVMLGMACLVSGAMVLSWSGQPTLSNVFGPLAVVGACVAWGLDNNLTRKVSLSDPLQIVELKGLIAGPVNLLLGLLAGGAMPTFSATMLAGLVGFVGYGVSLALFVLALRHLGSARTAAYFSTAPFLGALAAVALLDDPLTFQLVSAGLLMGVGVWLHLTELHSHEHEHEPIEHSHPHVHDEHHQHTHAVGDPPGEPHTHRHRHERQRHTHAHVPDMHHTHRHRPTLS
jgi:drug/metabolite transporter (DMT)-like permease